MKIPNFTHDGPWTGPLIGCVVGTVMVALAILLVRVSGITELAFPTTDSATYVDTAQAAELFKSCMVDAAKDTSAYFGAKVATCRDVSMRLSTTTLPPNCLQIVVLSNPVQYRCEKPQP